MIFQPSRYPNLRKPPYPPNMEPPGTLLMGPVSGVALGAAALYVAWTESSWSYRVVVGDDESGKIWQDGNGTINQ